MSETGKIGLGGEVSSLDVSPQFGAYSGVEIFVSENLAYFAGDRSGRVLSIQNEWGTQAQADSILASLRERGLRYQPYKAEGALLNPAAEIGDGVTVSDTYSGLYSIDREFGKLMKANISAPQDEEVDHEYPYESSTDREVVRRFGEVSAQITMTNESITSSVSDIQTSMNTMQANLEGEISESASAVESSLTSKIQQTASSIQSTVAASTSKYDTGSMDISFYGFGAPTPTNPPASGNKNKLYLDQSTGFYYKSNNSKWAKQNSTALKLITTNLSSQITQNSTEISAKVSQEGGSNKSKSFSWSLTAEGHKWYAGGASDPVVSIDKDGLSVRGKVAATSGYIGNSTSGFVISAKAIYNGMKKLSDTTNNGVYIGTDGIALGKGAFKVTSAGAVTASNLKITGGSISIGSNFSVTSAGNVSANNMVAKNMTLSGTLVVGGKQITAENLYSGATGGSSAYNWTSSNGSYCTGGASYGYNYNNATASGTTSYPSFFTCGYLYAKSGLNVTGSCNASSMSVANGITVGGYYTATWQSKTVKDSSGNNTTIYYLGRST